MARIRTALLSLLACLAGAACDNVGRAFDPVIDPPPGGQPTTGPSIVQVVPAGGDARSGRPTIKATAPKGGGWPTTVPVVVEFSESINEASIRPTTAGGTDGRILVRVKGTTAALPAQYDFLAGGRVLVIRPTPALSNAQNPAYEVVMKPEGRDCDGTRFQVSGTEVVLAEFTVDADPAQTDGRILTTFPRDNARDATLEGAFFAFFTKPPNATSITAQNFLLRPAGGTALSGTIDHPVKTANLDDTRVTRFRPTAAWAPQTRHEFVVANSITFGQDGNLNFSGRTPFSRFDTIAPAAPTAVTIANSPSGTTDKISRANIGTVRVAVTVPASASAGDVVVARLYGGDRSTQATGDLAFVEKTLALTASGAQTVEVDFSGSLGTIERPKFDDGAMSLGAWLWRGDQHSGFFLGGANTDARFDVTPPVLRRLGPPGVEAGNIVFTDLEYFALYGTANEQLGSAELTDGVNPPVGLFASAGDGRFLMRPIALGRLTAPRSFVLTFSDVVGNLTTAAINGSVVQRGVVTGAFTGTLVVEAYDDATLAPIGGATVLVDPGVPTVPATGQRVATTDLNGRATFTGLVAQPHTVTVIRSGYHLRTIYGTQASFVSLPLRPISNATANLRGNVVTASPTNTALIGNSAFDDPLLLSVGTSSSAPNAIPSTPIRPSRPYAVTAFGGSFEPTAVPAFASSACQLCGVNLATPTAPPAPPAPGADSSVDLALVPVGATIAVLSTTFGKDFSLATGLDTANLVGGRPQVRITSGLSGFLGQVLTGVGFATPGTGASFTVNGNYAVAIMAGLDAFAPTNWVVTEARDTSGRVSRHRALLVAPTGVVVDQLDAPGIPTITVPTAPITGSPAVTFEDRLFPGSIAAGMAIVDVQAQDADGRQWSLLVADTDPISGTDTVQFPDLASANVVGLRTGTWSVRAEGRLCVMTTTTSHDDLVLSERRNKEVTYARSGAVSFTIQ